MDIERIEPGLVIIRGALSQEEQSKIATHIIKIGRSKENGFWEHEENGSKQLNSTKTRGRIYQSLEWYGEEELLRDICGRVVTLAQGVDPDMPEMTPTHLLSLYYATKAGIGWHRDNGANDGRSDCPVVSFSLGNACDFGFKHEREDQATKVRLESGDALLFGGPARMILHSVTKVHLGTAPDWFSDIAGDARMNLTFRETPELQGREQEFKYFKPTKQKKYNKLT